MSPSVSASVPTIPVTVVLPVKNEAANLEQNLPLLTDFAEVVVVDSQSSDDTVAVAEAHGATVLQFVWNGRFPKKRNWTLQTHAFATEWVLFLDADEFVTPAFLAELREAIARPYSGYWIPYTIHFMGRQLKHGIRLYKLPLFRRSAGAYERIDEEAWSALDMEIHEHPILEGDVGKLSAAIDHREQHTLHHYIAKHNAYSDWEATRYLTLREDAMAWKTLYPKQRLRNRLLGSWLFAPLYWIVDYVLRGKFLDGRAGFSHAALKAYYYWQVKMKIDEQRRMHPTAA